MNFGFIFISEIYSMLCPEDCANYFLLFHLPIQFSYTQLWERMSLALNLCGDFFLLEVKQGSSDRTFHRNGKVFWELPFYQAECERSLMKTSPQRKVFVSLFCERRKLILSSQRRRQRVQKGSSCTIIFKP